MNTLSIQQLCKTYANGVKAIDNITLQLHNGVFGLLGANGAGKSSLMRTIAGLQKPDSGSIVFNGQNIIQNPLAIKSQLGYLPQDFGVYPKISAWNLLMHLAVLKGITNTAARKEQVSALLQQTNLFAHRHQAVHSFSGGMRQRFGITQALLGNPQVIIADEPTAGLDPEERNRFNNLLSEVGEQVIVILSTHLVEDVHNLCTQMAIMHQGALLAIGKPDEFVQALQGCIWSKLIDKKELPLYNRNYQVISSHFIAGRLHITIYATEQPQQGFTTRQPDLEDVYFTKLINA